MTTVAVDVDSEPDQTLLIEGGVRWAIADHEAEVHNRRVPRRLGEASLVGRASEQAEAVSRIDIAASGTVQVLLIEGEAGIGKTTLVTDTQRMANERGFEICAGGAVEPERGQPFSAISDVLRLHASSDDPRREAIGRLILGRPADAAPATFAQVADPGLEILEEIAALVEQLAAEAPLVFSMEDLHWADASSLIAFRSLARRLRGRPVLLLGSLRPVPRSAELRQTVEQLRRADAGHIILGPLTDEQIGELAQALLGARPSAELGTELSRSGGNPLFLVELINGLREAGLVAVREGQVHLLSQSGVHATGLHDTLLLSVHNLPDQTRLALSRAAILGAWFSLEDLASLADGRPLDVLEWIRPALDAGVIGSDADGLRFRHELIRDAIYADMPREARTRLHRRAAGLLAAAGRPSTQVAQQLALGALPGDAEAIAYLRSASRPEEAPAPVAAELLELALGLTEPDDVQRDEITADLAEALVWAGRLQEGEQLARELLSREGTHAAKAARVLLRALWVAGRWGELVQHVDPLIADDSLSATDSGHLLADSAMARLFCGEDAAAEAQALEALAIGRRERDAQVEFHALYSLAAIKDFRGPIPDGVGYAERSVELADSVEAKRYHPHFGVGMCLHSSDDMEGAERAFRQGQQVGSQLGTVWEMPLYHSGLAIVAFHTGRWDDAMAESETSVTVADEVGTRMGAVAARAFAARIAVHRSDLELADELTGAAQAELDALGPQWGAQWLMLAQAEALEARGETAAALELLLRIDAIFGAMIGVKMEMAPHIVRLAQAARDDGSARAATESVEAIAARAMVPRAQVSSLRCRGLMEDDPDRLIEAVDLYRSGTRLLERAALLEDAGTVNARAAGRRDAAVGLLSDSLRLYEELGAIHDVSRTTARLRDLGVRAGRRGRRGRPRSGWQAVTDTEHKVAALVVEGLTNRQIGDRLFISRYTVETHLKHLFTKLDLSTRVDLAREVTRRRTTGAHPNP